MPRPDDDALSWEGDDDPTLDTRVDAPADAGHAASAPVETPPATEPAVASEPPVADEPAAPPVAEEAAPRPLEEEPVEDEPRRLGDAALISLGVLGGVYLLWTVGWVLGSLRLRDWIQIRTGAVADAMFHGSMVLGILAPAIWFGAAWFLTRGRPTWVRIAAIVLGVIVLVPWPFVMVGVIGQ